MCPEGVVRNLIVTFRIRGWGAVWSMPAADQAAILPFVLTCVADGTHLIQDLAFN